MTPEHLVDINGLRYGVREAGSSNGQPVWMLHGLLDTGASFTALAKALEALAPGRYRFLAPDWRGHGHTGWAPGNYWFPVYLADLDQLIAAFTPNRAIVLIGHSMGGTVASQYAGLRPRRISHLVALDSLSIPDTPADSAPGRYIDWLDAMNNPPLPRRFDDPAALARRIGKRYPELETPMHQRLAADWAVADGADYRLHADPWHQTRFPYGFRAAESMAIWRRVTAAVLCIDGSTSPARRHVSDDDMVTRRACFQHIEHTVIDDAGHMLHLQMPETVAQRVQSFLIRADS